MRVRRAGSVRRWTAVRGYRPARASSAELTANPGCSVVPPTRVRSPDSTWGSRASCCALLKRWISSTNRIVFFPVARCRAFASSITSFTSLMPLVTALSGEKAISARPAIASASVVFPHPGGPQKISDGIAPFSNSRPRNDSRPADSSCPTNSSNDLGRIRSASGAAGRGAGSLAARFARALGLASCGSSCPKKSILAALRRRRRENRTRAIRIL